LPNILHYITTSVSVFKDIGYQIFWAADGL